MAHQVRVGAIERVWLALPRSTALIGIVLGVLLLAAGCSSSGETENRGIPGLGDSATNDDGSVGADGEAPTTTLFDYDAAYDLGDPISFDAAQLGECINEYNWVQERQPQNLLIALDCELPHDKEVYFTREFPAGPEVPYPGEELMNDYATRVCYNAFEEFVGQTYELSTYEIDHTYPPRDNYEVGRYREIICMVRSNPQTTGSAKGTGL